MAETYSQVQAAACESGIGKVSDEIKLLQALAQTSADFAEANVPGLDVSVAAIQERACTTGIGKITDKLQLLRIIAQLLNDQQS